MDEKTRLDLRQAFEDLIGPELASAAMEAMPPLDYENLATKTDVANLRDEMTARFEQVDAKFDQVDARFEQIDARFNQIAGRFEQVDGRFEQMDGRFAQLEGRLEQRLAQNLRVTVATQVGTMAAFAGLIIGLG